MLTMGVDIGSTASKAVIIRDGEEIVAYNLIPLGTGTRGPEEVYENTLAAAGVTREQVDRIIVTGYGRLNFTHADKQISEVSCHARGIRFLLPSVRTVIDIGGQDIKAMRIGPQGQLTNFVMNDKCAAGTGRFLDVMARVLDVKTEELGEISARSTKEISISNTCTVFAESEVISRLSDKEDISDIVAGIHSSVAKRVAGLALRVGVEGGDIAMSGGVALNTGVVRAMEQELKKPILVHEHCQLAGAIGAAMFAYDDIIKAQAKAQA